MSVETVVKFMMNITQVGKPHDDYANYLRTYKLGQGEKCTTYLHSIAQRLCSLVFAFHCMGIASSPLRAMPTPAPRNDARCERDTWRPPQADDGSLVDALVIASHGMAAKQIPLQQRASDVALKRSDVNGESGWSVYDNAFYMTTSH